MNRPVKLKKRTEFKLPTGVLGASLAADANTIVAACMDGVYRQSLETGEHEKLYAHQSYASSVHWINEDLIVSAGYDGVVHWFSPSGKAERRELKLHDFWSWDMAVSTDGKVLASVTGQYLAGGYKYEPAAEKEPSLCLVSVADGQVLQQLPHVPSVQAVAISPDGRFVAAGNLMGEIRVFEVESGRLVANWTTPDFTSWGIIKSHCYLGGIFAIEFTPDGEHILVAGMGPMRDPMAGNGKQLWQKWNWRGATPTKVDQTHEGDAGEGLMETLAVHPAGEHFVMGGRLRGGDWNVAVFAMTSGDRIATLKTGYRVTEARFTADGARLLLVGAQGQPSARKDGQFPPFGRVEVHDVEIETV